MQNKLAPQPVWSATLLYWQPSAGTQVSAVHGFLSSQLMTGPATHEATLQLAPHLHVSGLVQRDLSASHAWPCRPLPSCWQAPLWASQLSTVQTFESSQFFLTPAIHALLTQASETVQASPSASQLTVLAACWQPAMGEQLSVLQTFLSSQSTTAPPWHEPPRHASPLVQALPSSQGADEAMCWQPLAKSQESAVHGLLSSQAPAPLAMPTQLPALQVSPSVHALLSSQPLALLACWQPSFMSQESSVQTLLSLQSTGVPPQLPSLQPSPLVQAVPSSQAWPWALFCGTHCPVAKSQDAVWHCPAAWQVKGVPAVHCLPTHKSPTVQAFPSLQGALSLAVLVHPVAGWQASMVQGFASSHCLMGPEVQSPSTQESPSVHALPSASQAPGALTCEHDFCETLQVSRLHGLASSQAPSSVWPLQLSSSPLQVSVAPWGALQALRPATAQTRVPLQVPILAPESSLTATEQAVANCAETAAAEHVHCPGPPASGAGTHC